MPSDRKQINVRLDGDAELLMARLIPAVRSRLGLPISQSDLFRLALAALAEEYAAELARLARPAAEPPPPPKRRRGRND